MFKFFENKYRDQIEKLKDDIENFKFTVSIKKNENERLIETLTAVKKWLDESEKQKAELKEKVIWLANKCIKFEERIYGKIRDNSPDKEFD